MSQLSAAPSNNSPTDPLDQRTSSPGSNYHAYRQQIALKTAETVVTKSATSPFAQYEQEYCAAGGTLLLMEVTPMIRSPPNCHPTSTQIRC
jgi:hypothetical protein